MVSATQLFTTFFILYAFLGVWTHRVYQSLVDYYTELVTNYTKRAPEYKFPINARMYESRNKIPIGEIPY